MYPLEVNRRPINPADDIAEKARKGAVEAVNSYASTVFRQGGYPDPRTGTDRDVTADDANLNWMAGNLVLELARLMDSCGFNSPETLRNLADDYEKSGRVTHRK